MILDPTSSSKLGTIPTLPVVHFVCKQQMLASRVIVEKFHLGLVKPSRAIPALFFLKRVLQKLVKAVSVGVFTRFKVMKYNSIAAICVLYCANLSHVYCLRTTTLIQMATHQHRIN